MTDNGANSIARAIRFLGLCLLRAIVFWQHGSPDVTPNDRASWLKDSD